MFPPNVDLLGLLKRPLFMAVSSTVWVAELVFRIKRRHNLLDRWKIGVVLNAIVVAVGDLC
jgi:hypothetical protein